MKGLRNHILHLFDGLARRTSGWLVFFLFILTRSIFVFFSGFDHYQLNPDSVWIQGLAEKAAQSNFDFDIGRFIVSPFYQVFCAAHRLLFPVNWEWAIIVSQILISALSGLYLYRTALLLFDKTIATITSLLYAIFPMTLWWTGTLSSESLFESLVIFSIYFLLRFLREQNIAPLIFSAIFFSLAFLTKSHFLLFSPFIVLLLFLNRKKVFHWWAAAALYGSICLMSTLPFGTYCLRHYNVYVISSNGSSFHFYTGNSTFGYKAIVDVPSKNSEGFEALKQLDFAYYNGDEYNAILELPVSQRQHRYLDSSLQWIKDHPLQFAELKAANAAFFLLPGVSFRHYELKQWLLIFLLSLPIYLFAYLFLIRIIKQKEKEHYYFVFLFLTILAFSVVYYVQNRFRTITIEPYYLMYASAGFLIWLRNKNSITDGDSVHL